MLRATTNLPLREREPDFQVIPIDDDSNCPLPTFSSESVEELFQFTGMLFER